MNVAAHQKKNKYKNTGRREAEKEKKRQAIEFKETQCWFCAIVQRTARRKNDWMRGVPRVTGTLGKANSNFDPLYTG